MGVQPRIVSASVGRAAAASSAPTLVSITPSSGSHTIPTAIALVGTGFDGGNLSFDSPTGLTIDTVIVVNATHATANVPAGNSADIYDVVAHTDAGDSAPLVAGFEVT